MSVNAELGRDLAVGRIAPPAGIAVEANPHKDQPVENA
jgi:hypothetical protein